EIFADSSFVFTNSNPYLDYPRPMLHKTVPIGGVAVNIDPKKNVLSKIPVFADQIRNAQMLAKHGGGIVLSKTALEHPEEVKNVLEKILHDPSFAENAKRLSEMLLNQPVSAKQLLIKHCEFAARFGRLPNLDPYGRHLSFIEYYLIDIFLVVLGVIIFVAFVVYKIVR
ncbi:hypothetical protein TELCIR_18624, partial [Teladorsagia circumcincta]